MAGYTYSDTFDNAHSYKFIKINNCEDFNLKILIVQAHTNQSLINLNTTSIKYLKKKNIPQFENIEVLSISDCNYKKGLNV